MAVIHPLFRLIASQPQMIADHVEAYSDLVADEVATAVSGLKRRLAFAAVALASGSVALVLAGVALMLWAVTPIDSMNAPWALMAVPGAFVVIAVACLMAAREAAIGNGFKTLREQLAADAAMLRQVSEGAA